MVLHVLPAAPRWPASYQAIARGEVCCLLALVAVNCYIQAKHCDVVSSGRYIDGKIDFRAEFWRPQKKGSKNVSNKIRRQVKSMTAIFCHLTFGLACNRATGITSTLQNEAIKQQ